MEGRNAVRCEANIKEGVLDMPRYGFKNLDSSIRFGGTICDYNDVLVPVC